MKRTFAFLILSACLLAACGPQATPPLFGNGPISECFPSHKAQVWEDVNGNGLFDEGEKPLAGIAVTMYPIPRRSRSFPTNTDGSGIAALHGIGDFGPKCDQLEVEVSVPHTYLPTTPTLVSLVGLPGGQTLNFGLISQFPTPTASSRVPSGSFVRMDKLLEGGNSFDACSLLTADEFAAILGAPLEKPLINSAAIAEFGPATYDCMTDPSEPAAYMYYALAIESDPDKAESWFNEIGSQNPQALTADNVGEQARYWTNADGVAMNLIALRGNVYMNLQLHFGVESSPDQQAILFELARALLESLFERGG